MFRVLSRESSKGTGGGSRIPVGGGAKPRGARYKFARFSQKLPDINNIFVRRGVRAGSGPRSWIRHWEHMWLQRDGVRVCGCWTFVEAFQLRV